MFCFSLRFAKSTSPTLCVGLRGWGTECALFKVKEFLRIEIKAFIKDQHTNDRSSFRKEGLIEKDGPRTQHEPNPILHRIPES